MNFDNLVFGYRKCPVFTLDMYARSTRKTPKCRHKGVLLAKEKARQTDALTRSSS